MPYSKKTLFKRGTIPFVAFLFLFSLSPTFAQVSIAPTALFFNSQSRFSSLTVSNGGQQSQEITIATEFGYPTSENGNLIISRDSMMARQKSLAPWLKMFPERFTLKPNQRQVVRFVAQVPQNLDPGGYWSRIKITSNPVSPPIETVGDNQIGAQINLVVEQVIAAHYRTPDATTGVKVTSIDFDTNENGEIGIVTVAMQQTGNAPFIGSIDMGIKDPAGNTVYQSSTTNSVYTDISRTFTANISDWRPGVYTINGTISTERRDIDQSKLLRINPVSFIRKITIN